MAKEELEETPSKNTTHKKVAEESFDDLESDTEYTDNGMRPHFFRPAIICGVCEHCGSSEYVGGEVKKMTNGQGEVEHRYTGGKWEPRDASSCKHYSALNIQCTYCGERFTGLRTKLGKFAELLATRIVYVMSFVEQPKKVIMYCDSFECKEKHIKRMNNAA